jgi:hypothetical protein
MSNWTEKDLQNRPGVRNVSDSRESGTRMRFPQGGKGGPRKQRSEPEAQEQREFFKLVRSLEPIYSELQMVRSDQAGMRTHPAQANKAKAGGMRRGFPDIDVPIARGGYTGMHIEMKSECGQLTEDQKWWLAQLRDQGRKCVVCRSARQAWEELSKYLGIEQEV